MALEFFTGFEGCGAVADVYPLFSTSYGDNIYLSSTGGYDGSKCMSMRYNGWLRRNITDKKTVCTGFHIKGLALQAYSATQGYALVWFAGPDIRVFNSATGLDIRVGATQVALAGSNIDVAQHHVEIKVFSDAAAGTVQIKVDGALVVDLSGANTGGADITAVEYGAGSGSMSYFDNMFIADDFQGELKSYLLQPTSDAAVQFTPLSGTDNFAMVDDAGQDGDTTYVSSGTLSQMDLYGYADLPVGMAPKAVALVTVARKDDVGDRSIQAMARQDLTDYVVGEKVLTNDYPAVVGSAFSALLNTAPDATAWTRDKLNAIDWGVKVSV